MILLDDVGYSLLWQLREAYQMGINRLCGARDLTRTFWTSQLVDPIDTALRQHCRDLEQALGDMPASYAPLIRFPPGHWRAQGDSFMWYFTDRLGWDRGEFFKYYNTHREFFRRLDKEGK